MGYSLDICILGICLICVIAGVRRGFIRSLVHFLGAIVAAGLASVFGGYLAHWLFNTLFRDAMVDKIDASLRTMGVENAALTAEQLLANLPDFIVRGDRSLHQRGAGFSNRPGGGYGSGLPGAGVCELFKGAGCDCAIFPVYDIGAGAGRDREPNAEAARS